MIKINVINIIADYLLPDGQHAHRAYYIPLPASEMAAVTAVRDVIRQSGCRPLCASVVPGMHTVEELKQIAENFTDTPFRGYLFQGDRILGPISDTTRKPCKNAATDKKKCKRSG